MRFCHILIFISVLVLLFSCRKDSLITDPSAKLDFSRDTLAFDTVFTTIGSATRYFIVYNTNNKAIKISDIHLAGGSSSAFRLNIDGVATNQASDVEIAPKDSLYVFAAVTVDPGNVNNPFIISDSVLFETNGNHQHVILAAWGQDGHFYYDSVITSNQTWTNDKPYVIINSILVNKDVTLTIDPGCTIYNHPGSFIYVAGTIKVGGDGDSVTFQGDRLESYYQDLPGGWGGIVLGDFSHDNVIENAVIRDGSTGIIMGKDTTGSSTPKLTMKRTIIKNMLFVGISAAFSTLYAENSLIFNIGEQNCLQLYVGGTYKFENCTFANYTSATINHQKPVVYLSDNLTVNNEVKAVGDLSTNFKNCIISGSLEKEISLDDYSGAGQFKVTWDYCYVRPADTITGAGVIKDDPLFADVSKNDYKITSSSPCRDNGVDNGTKVDITGFNRDTKIDIGAYEYH